MDSNIKLTTKQAEEKMKIYREVFDVVRIIKSTDIRRMQCGQEPELDENMCRCYDFWNKDKQCENCVSEKALTKKKQYTKLECLENNIYQIIAKYLEIDGVPCVMEMVHRLDNENLIDNDGRRILMDNLTGYKNELYRDPLTGVYNRRYYEDNIKDLNENAGVAMIDLDDFKLYNDSYGHNAGDMALETIVSAIKKCIRSSDKIIRLGGDEFLLVLPGIHSNIFNKKLQQIRTRIKEAKVDGYSKIRLSVSIGGVMTHNETIESAMYRADKLMLQAKSQQKGMVVTEENEFGVIDNESEVKDRQRVLVVDDSYMNRMILTEILKSDYEIINAASGEECLEIIEKYGTGIDIILLDIVMPGMDGFEVLNYMNNNNWIEDIPVILISSEDSNQYIRRAYEMGVSDYISRPFDAKVVYQRVLNTIKLYAKQRRLINLITDQVYEKEKNNKMMIDILSQIVEFRNNESGMHVRNISTLTGMLLEKIVQKTDKYYLSWSKRFYITNGSALHDIGKIGIPEEILNKPGNLTKEEYEIMKEHTVIGEKMLKNLELYQDEPLVKTACEIVRWHHERYDGKGYPDGLKGDEIPISAQIVSIADVYDELVSERVYKKAFSHEKAMEMILNGEYGAFNPLLLECLVEIQDRIKTELDGSGSVKKETYKKTIQEIERDMNMNTL